MLSTVLSFFDRPVRDPHFDDLPFDRAKFAAAVLMVELARCDGNFDDAENNAIHRMIQRRLELNADQAEGLVQLAEDEILSYWDDCWNSRRFRKRILEDCSLSERVRIVEMLWEVVYADGTVDPYETSLMWQLAEGIGVDAPTTEHAKRRVAKRSPAANQAA